MTQATDCVEAEARFVLLCMLNFFKMVNSWREIDEVKGGVFFFLIMQDIVIILENYIHKLSAFSLPFLWSMQRSSLPSSHLMCCLIHRSNVSVNIILHANVDKGLHLVHEVFNYILW